MTRPLRLHAAVLVAVAIGVTLGLAPPSTAPAADVTVRLRVLVPPGTTPPVYLTGSLPALGPWRPDALRLTPEADGAFTAELSAPPGTAVEFKVTRGSWATVEKTADGSERPNRTVTFPAAAEAAVEVRVEAWATGAAAARKSTVTGTLKLHEAFESKALANRRTIRVWLPPRYDAAGNAAVRYPVLYFHDGQNLFDAATSSFGTEWGVDEAATALISAGKIPPVIVVGIDNTPDRISEYTADPAAPDSPLGGGKGAAYCRFVTGELKPFIDRTYRTAPDRAHTYTAGSSLGGLVSLQLLREHPGTFSRAAVVSPALWWANEAELKRWESDAAPLPEGTRLWLDMGTHEGAPGQWGRYLDTTRRLHVAIARRGVRPLSPPPTAAISYEEDAGAEHNERAWQARTPRMLEFLLKP